MGRDPVRRSANVNQAARRCVVAPDAGGHFQNQLIAAFEFSLTPDFMLEWQAFARSDEGSKSNRFAAFSKHGFMNKGRDLIFANALCCSRESDFFDPVGNCRRATYVFDLTKR